MALNFETIMGSITSELKAIAKTESIIGEPIEIDGKTIIPVIKMKLGFGGGSGEETVGGKSSGGAGGGGGGGIGIEPAAFITIVGDEISVLSPKGSKFEKLAGVVPGIVSKIMEAQGGKSETPSETPEDQS